MSEKTNQTLEEPVMNTAEEQITPEEYAKLRKEAVEHLKGEIKYLEIEEQYEKLQADIEEHKTRRYVMIARQAELFQKNNSDQGANTTPEQPMPRRPLKTD